MNIRLSDHFTYGRLLRFTFPSVIMLVFTSIYGVVDGFFVSNFAGKTPFAAVNFIMPLLMILGCAGFMFGTGGGALIAKTLGEGKREKANELFSLIVYTSIICGVVLAVFGFLCIRPAASRMGAEGRLLSDSVRYGWIVLLALPFYVLQFEFQCLFVTAEKPKLGLYVTVASGVTNIVLDALFVAVFHWGMEGHGFQPVCRRRGSARLFWAEQRKSSAACETKGPSGYKGSGPYLYQWLLRAHEQYLHVAGQHAV